MTSNQNVVCNDQDDDAKINLFEMIAIFILFPIVSFYSGSVLGGMIFVPQDYVDLSPLTLDYVIWNVLLGPPFILLISGGFIYVVIGLAAGFVSGLVTKRMFRSMEVCFVGALSVVHIVVYTGHGHTFFHDLFIVLVGLSVAIFCSYLIRKSLRKFLYKESKTMI